MDLGLTPVTGSQSLLTVFITSIGVAFENLNGSSIDNILVIPMCLSIEVLKSLKRELSRGIGQLYDLACDEEC